MTKPNNIDPLDSLVHRIFMAGYEAGKRSGLTMVIASDTIEPAAVAEFRQLLVQERLEESKLSREGFVVAYQRYEGNEHADEFLRKVIEAFDERIAELESQLTQPKEN